MTALLQRFNHKKNLQQGFTLIELMVTITIVVLVTAVVVVQYSSFNSAVLLTGQAYQTAFDLREVQSYAISVRADNVHIYNPYGVYFDILSSYPNQYVLFQDTNGTQDPVEYQSGEAIGVPYSLGARFKLINLCVTNTGGQKECYRDDPSTTGEIVNPSLHDLSISFIRPNFDAHFSSSAMPSGIKSVEIHIGTNDSSKIKKVVISTAGQISVQN